VKILRLKADAFGPLTGEYSFDPGRLTLLVDRNETGKSTLIAAVSAALYGLEGDRRSHKVLTPLERWRPWVGGSYRVELDLESEGETFTIKRDFERGTVEVWNDRGLEVTASFREGKDEFPVGKKLLGLDADEFEKCALVRQGELDQVVPADERGRRANSLQARLEGAADTRGGDTSAAEALQVLQGALRKYTVPELEFTGTVENAISRLDLKRETLLTDLKTLEHDRLHVATPLEELARLGAEEQAARDAVARLEAERHAGLAAELERRLREQRERRCAVDALRAEAAGLAAYAHLPETAEAELRETIIKLEEAQKNVTDRESRRQEEQSRSRGELEKKLGTLADFAGCGVEDADRLVALAADMRRLAGEDTKLRDQVTGLREGLSGRGFDPTRVEALTARFSALTEEQQKLLADQAAVALAFQTEVASLEQERTENTEALRQIDAARAGRRLPGWFLLALGAGAAAAGAVVLAIHGEWNIGASLLGGGLGLAAVGLLLAAAAAAARGDERENALHNLSEAQGRLNQLKSRRAESEVALGDLARRLGHRDAVELMRDWNEHQRMQEETNPVQRAQDQVQALESHRRDVLTEVRERLDRAGGGPLDPAHLESVAFGIRHMLAVRQQLEDLEKGWSWVDEEKRVFEASVAGLTERAVRLLELAGLTYDPAVPWRDQMKELADRARMRGRLALLESELIPKAEQALAPASEVTDLEAQLAALRAEGGPESAPEPGAPTREARGSGAPAPRAIVDVDREVRRQREIIELVQRKRGDLRQQVDEVVRRAAQREPELIAEQTRIEQAAERARRFKRTVELAASTLQSVALETHRRWGDFLGRRVGELLDAVGAQAGEVRFGEDLDFSVRLREGQQLARGKALLQLSVGARDQLHLAVRLAISEFLSRPGQPLPLLLDDVFASSDDERARAGMRLLIEGFAREHQIIVMTCHRHRHEQLASLDPELWKSVRWMEVAPAVRSR